jgi:hypothetical protein
MKTGRVLHGVGSFEDGGREIEHEEKRDLYMTT